MAKLVGKGTVLKQDIASVLTAVAQITDISLSGAGTETFDSTDLSTTKWKEFASTGYANPGTANFGLFYDPALVGHQTITDEIGVTAAESWQIAYSNASSTQSFTAFVQDFGVNIVMNDAVKATVALQITGDPGFTT